MILARKVGRLRHQERQDASPVPVFAEYLHVSRIGSDCVGVFFFFFFFFKFIFLSRLASVWTGRLVIYYTCT